MTMNSARRGTLLLMLAGLLLPGLASAERLSERERQAQQRELDIACEVAREKAMAPKRREIFRECMAEKGDREQCIGEAEQYGGNRIRGAALHYDLPECEAAFEFRREHRDRY